MITSPKGECDCRGKGITITSDRKANQKKKALTGFGAGPTL